MFEHLRLFRDIAQSRNISKAANDNSITPSAASQHISELERTLGVTLLDRSTRPLSLTPEGRLYYDMCKDVLRKEDEFRSALDNLRTAVEGTVRVVAIYSVGLSEMTELAAEFRRRFPQVQLEVEYLRPERVYEAVTADRADLGLVSYPEPAKEISILPWRNEEMVLTASPAHPLMRKASVSPADLQGVDFVTFDNDLPIGREIARYLKSHGVEVKTTMHFDNLQTIKEAVMLGSRVSIVPARILRAEIVDGRLAAVPLEQPGLYRPVGIIHRRKKRFSRAVLAFLELLEQAPHPTPPLEPVIAR